MKILQKRVNVVYRFRCNRCKSKFEMTEEEKLENDWKFDEGDKSNPHHTEPINPMNHFYFPVCECVRYVNKYDFHRYSIMDNGFEVRDY